MLSAVSTAITVSGIVAVLAAYAQLDAEQRAGSVGLDGARIDRLSQAMLVITVIAGHPGGRQRGLHHLGDGPRRQAFLSAGTRRDPSRCEHRTVSGAAAPALAGAVVGIPGGVALFAAVSGEMVLPPPWQLLAVLPASALAVAALTAIPARVGARRR